MHSLTRDFTSSIHNEWKYRRTQTKHLVYVEWAKKWSRVNFVTIFGDLYKIELWGICNNFSQFAHLSLASGPSNDVIKMAAIAQL